MRTIYLGSAICRMSRRGGMMMPPEFRRTAHCQNSESELVVGLHDTSNCLVVGQESFLIDRHVHSAGCDGASDRDGSSETQNRNHRTFGFADYFVMDEKGSVNIPPLMCQLAGLGETLFLVSSGQTFEIWDMDHLLAAGPENLKLLANHILLHKPSKEKWDEKDKPALPHTRSHASVAGYRVDPGLCVQ